MWDGGDKVKSQRDLAKGAKMGIKDDVKMLDYYRFMLIILYKYITLIIHDYCVCEGVL